MTRQVQDYEFPNGATISLTYDRNGNLTDDGENYIYVYSPFGQLVRVTERRANPGVIAEYTCSAMGTLLSERLDTNRATNDGIADGVITSADPVFYIAADTSGKRIETYRGTDSSPKAVFFHHPSSSPRPASRRRRQVVGQPTPPQSEHRRAEHQQRSHAIPCRSSPR